MTREIIEDFRFIVIPYMVNRLKEINYEGQGGSDAKEFMSNFNEICDMAIKALEQLPKLQNRCFALTHGQICMFCPYDCERRTTEYRSEE